MFEYLAKRFHRALSGPITARVQALGTLVQPITNKFLDDIPIDGFCCIKIGIATG